MRILVLLIGLLSCSAPALAEEGAVFHAKFNQVSTELEINIPSHLIVPTIKSHFDMLEDKELSRSQIDLFLEMYLRDTIKLQYGAYPMALGESGISHKNGVTSLVMKLAKLPNTAKELIVQINSFSQMPKHKNLFQISLPRARKEQVALNYRNAFSTNFSL